MSVLPALPREEWEGRKDLFYKSHFPSLNPNITGSPAPWNYLWKPGPLPETDDERRAAAKKYGMIYEDYKPSNEPDTMMGDYPQLPVEPAHEK